MCMSRHFFSKCTLKSGSCIEKYFFRLGQAEHEMGWYSWASIKPQLVCLNPWQGCKADCLSARSAHVSQKHSICVEVQCKCQSTMDEYIQYIRCQITMCCIWMLVLLLWLYMYISDLELWSLSTVAATTMHLCFYLLLKLSSA